MMSDIDDLINALLVAPESFEAAGRGNAILQSLFAGASISKLTPLFDDKRAPVRRTLAWLLSELGTQAKMLLVPARRTLQDSRDVYESFLLMEFIFLVDDGNGGGLCLIVNRLDDENEALRIQAMTLLTFATSTQFDAMLRCSARVNAVAQKLEMRTPQGFQTSVEVILVDGDPLTRRIGAALAARKIAAVEWTLERLAATGDNDIRQFARTIRHRLIR